MGYRLSVDRGQNKTIRQNILQLISKLQDKSPYYRIFFIFFRDYIKSVRDVQNLGNPVL